MTDQHRGRDRAHVPVSALLPRYARRHLHQLASWMRRSGADAVEAVRLFACRLPGWL